MIRELLLTAAVMPILTLSFSVGGQKIMMSSVRQQCWGTTPGITRRCSSVCHALPPSDTGSSDYISSSSTGSTTTTIASNDSSNSSTTTTTTTGHDDLTKEELGLRIAEVRAYYRKTNELSQKDACLSLLRTRFPNLQLNRSFTAQSTIVNAGRGLFASRDINEGELITLYPGDALLAWNTTVGDFEDGVGVMFGTHVESNDLNANRVTTAEARSFELKIGPKHSIVADPLLTDDPAYIGHMANDGAILTERTNAAREIYSKATVDLYNAAFFVMEGSHFVTVAAKPISKNEEIFVSYGEGYWMSRSYSIEQDATDVTDAPASLPDALDGSAAKNGISETGTKSTAAFGKTANTKNRKKKRTKQKKQGGFGK
eukprot:scaffold11980_cov287-Chaetoceros_neogracile.AAC.2